MRLRKSMKKELTYGLEGIKEIQDFIKENRHDNTYLEIQDGLTRKHLKVLCSCEDIVDVVLFVCRIEYDFPEYIEFNKNKYIVTLDFTRGKINTGKTYRWDTKCKQLVERG